MVYITTTSHSRSARRRLLLTLAAITLGALVPVSGSFAQPSIRQVVDTGMLNTRASRPMRTPRSAGGMEGMKDMQETQGTKGMQKMEGMQEMKGMQKMEGMQDVKDTTGMADMSDMAGVSGMRGGSDSSMQAIMALHARMMADPVIRQRVMSDTALRRLAGQGSALKAPEHADKKGIRIKNSSPSRGSAKAAPRGARKTAPAKKPPAKKPPTMPPMPGMDDKMPGMEKR